MWLAIVVLFIVLSPGVVFTAPGRGKVLVAAIHAVIFVSAIYLLDVIQEGFQAGGSQRTLTRAEMDILTKKPVQASSVVRKVADSVKRVATQISSRFPVTS